MNESKLSRLEGSYLKALRGRLNAGVASGPEKSRALGRRALALGMERAALEQMHAEALAALDLPNLPRGGAKARRALAEVFLVQAAEAMEADASPAPPAAGQLLREAVGFQKRLQALVHRLMATDETQRKEVGRKLQEEIVQSFISVQLQITTLDRQMEMGTVQLQKEIASTQKMVQQSAKTVGKLSRGSDKGHES